MSSPVNFPKKFAEIVTAATTGDWQKILSQKNSGKMLGKFAVYIINKTDWPNYHTVFAYAQKAFELLFSNDSAFEALPKNLLEKVLTCHEIVSDAAKQIQAVALQAAILENTKTHKAGEIIGVGIENSANACYVISVLQALRHLPKLKEALKEESGSKPIKELFFAMIKKLDCGTAVSAKEINEFRECAIKEGFIAESKTSQECAMLFCQFLLDKLGFQNFSFQTPVSHALEFPIPSLDRQEGTTNILSLPLGLAKEGTELKELLMANWVKEEVDLNAIYKSDSVYLSEEVLEKLHEFSKKPDDIDTLQTILLTSLEAPKILAVAIRRYSHNRKEASKNKTKIIPSDVLKLATKARDGKIAVEEYRLKSMVMHSGTSVNNGHYFTFVTQRDRWIEFNDARVVEHKEPKTQKRIPGDKDSVTPLDESAENGYLFFYQKI